MEEGNHGGIDASKGGMGPSRRDFRLGCNLHLDETSNECHPARNLGIWSNTRCCNARWWTISHRVHCSLFDFKTGPLSIKISTIVERRSNTWQHLACWFHHPDDRARFNHTIDISVLDLALRCVYGVDYDGTDWTKSDSDHDLSLIHI